ncbi:MAG: hypothetical protein ACKVT2_01850 [Saprospiraceae bacterium]
MNVTLQLVSPEDLQVLLPLLERLHISYQIGQSNAEPNRLKKKIPKGVKLTEAELQERLIYLAEGRTERSLPNR